MGAFTGFEPNQHLGQSTEDQPGLGWLVRRFGIRSMLDVGCGPGPGMAASAHRWNVEWKGVDGDPVCTRPGVTCHDYRDGPLYIERRFDLCWSVEFVEHIEEEFVPNVLWTFEAARVLVLSHAVPGQDGVHHVNCQPAEYWLRRLQLAGWDFRERDTATLRRETGNQWVRATGLVFNRPNFDHR